jgi:hypothetical protein
MFLSKTTFWVCALLQLDIRSFFMSIDKTILFRLLEKKIMSEYEKQSNQNAAYALLYLIWVTIFHDCTKNYVFKGNPESLKHIPPHKSLFKIPPNKGLPIGNLTSQFFANVYLNELDQFVKHQLKCRYYMRYVDDFILVSHDKNQLMEWKAAIEIYIAKHLELTLKESYTLRRVSEGANFLGYIVRPNYILVRNRVVNNFKNRMQALHDEICHQTTYNEKPVLKILNNGEKIFELQQVVSSYLGHFKHANSYDLRKKLFRRHSWIEHVFLIDNNKLSIDNRLCYKGVFRSFRGQVAFFQSRFPNCISMIQVGRYFEVFNFQAIWMHRAFRLKLRENVRKTQFMVGFPMRWKDTFIEKVVATGTGVIIILETGHGPFLRQREITEIYIPSGENHA